MCGKRAHHAALFLARDADDIAQALGDEDDTVQQANAAWVVAMAILLRMHNGVLSSWVATTATRT